MPLQQVLLVVLGKDYKYFFREGANKVVLVDINEKALDQFSKELKAKGFSAIPYKADVSDEHEMEEILHQILDKFKKIDILVNNAGVTQSSPI